MNFWAMLAKVGLTIAGTEVAAEGQKHEAEMMSNYLKAQALTKEKEAIRTGRRALENVKDAAVQLREDVGSSRVAAAKSGVRVGAGSAGRAEQKIVNEYRRGRIRYGQDVTDTIWALRTEAFYMKKMARDVKRAGFYKQTATRLQGASSMTDFFNR